MNSITGDPLLAGVRAWAAGTVGNLVDTCVAGEATPLDAADSSTSDGMFTLQIDVEHRFYETTVCSDGFVPARQFNLENKADGFPVMPTPVKLWPKDMSVEGSEEYVNRVVAAATAALNELHYLSSLDPELFNQVLEAQASAFTASSDSSAAAFWTLAEASGQWGK